MMLNYSLFLRLMACLLFICALLAHSPASAKEYATWAFACEPAAADCRMANDVRIGGELVSQILIYRVQGINIVEVLLPLGLAHLEPPYIEVDGYQKYDLQFLTCNNSGCILYAPKGDNVISAFRRGLQAKVKFVGFNGNLKTEFKFGLEQFNGVYEQYLKAGR